MPAKLKTRHALAVAAALLAGSLAVPSGASFAQMGNMPMSKDAPKTAAKSATGTGPGKRSRSTTARCLKSTGRQ